jgi:hypothetical protein
MSTMSNTTPNIPLGPYPHPLLCGQVGTVPIRSTINTISSIVPNDIAFHLTQLLVSV